MEGTFAFIPLNLVYDDLALATVEQTYTGPKKTTKRPIQPQKFSPHTKTPSRKSNDRATWNFWSGEQDLNLRQLGICGLHRLE